ncbi:branched-chain amino acid ABC transporter permease [Thalassovita sp.]|uniref:branched-chain amino acid ABC transporter permease n=1 Tax=Thalassovita sp. TaxID=1979401 RepID=UPI003B59E745
MSTPNILPLPRGDRRLIAVAIALFAALLLLPLVGSALMVDKLTLLFVYVMIAMMWNLMAGYAGLVSVGQQAFVGLGGYAMIRLVDAGMPPFPAIFAGAALTLFAAWVLSWFVLRMKAGEFAIATWVLAEVIRSLVSFDPLIQGETGTSLVALNAYDPDLRRNAIYLLALGSVAVMLVFTWRLLRGRLGAESQAIRDDEEAAASVGISTMRVKRMIYLAAAFGIALAGGLWLASAITFQPRTAFGVQWSVFMLFMVLVGGLGSFIGPILGAILFFALQEIFGDFGAWYLAGIGLVAIGFALYVPRGLVGLWQDRGRAEPLSMRKLLNNDPILKKETP